MNKLVDIIVSTVLSIVALLLWVYYMLMTSDAPVNVSFNEVIILALAQIFLLGLYSFYIRKSKYLNINLIFILLPLLLWVITLTNDIIYNYHLNATIASIVGFIITMITFIEVILNKNRKNC